MYLIVVQFTVEVQVHWMELNAVTSWSICVIHYRIFSRVCDFAKLGGEVETRNHHRFPSALSVHIPQGSYTLQWHLKDILGVTVIAIKQEVPVKTRRLPNFKEDRVQIEVEAILLEATEVAHEVALE